MASYQQLALLGFGNVGQALAELLAEKEDLIRRQYGVTYRVIGICTRSHGCAVDPDGIDLERAVKLAKRSPSIASLNVGAEPPDATAFLRSCGADIVFESTPVNYSSGQPALEYLHTALECGMHAITANKGPVVHGFGQLTELATRKGKRFLFESTVMDGAPVFSLWRETMHGAVLMGFRGVLNSTTNFILTEMEDGAGLEQALEHAQAIGVAETDPSGDLEGWDAAVKVAALVTVLMGRLCTPAQVERQGITGLQPEDIRAARNAERRWKLVCSAEWEGGALKTRVAPEQVGPGDPLYTVSGTSSALTLFTDTLPKLTIVEGDPGPKTTAFGMLADFLRAVAPWPGAPGG